MPTYVSGRIYGNFQIIKDLPHGLSGNVYYAVHSKTGEHVALKLLQNKKTQVRLHFLNEQKLLSLAQEDRNHPHIVRLVHSNVSEEPYSIATIFIDACNHRQLARLRSSALALRVVEQIGSALDYLHYQHPYHPVIHRDVKPDNILIDRRQGNATLIDFSVAAHPHFALVDDRSFGTPQYMAPEQYIGEEVPASDQFALALVAYYYLTGEPLIDRGGLASARKQIKGSDSQDQAVIARALEEWQALVRAELASYHSILRQKLSARPNTAQALERALAFDPEQRYPTCDAFADRLRAALIADSAPISLIKIPETRERSSWLAPLLTGSLIVGAAAALIFSADDREGYLAPPAAGTQASNSTIIVSAPATITLPPDSQPVLSDEIPAITPGSPAASPTMPPTTPTETPVQDQTGRIVTVTAPREIFRKEPSHAAQNVLGNLTLRAGEQLEILEGPLSPKGSREEWYKARRLSDGIEGWLRSTAFN
ncbi:MAG: hypothetical protein KatS3mg057_2876 [Herpetosiphonaceae bacterium]|nr:MAG: hypothetical protein KatS3mg057_2876 [Herpetosiphonaceae bacterium]